MSAKTLANVVVERDIFYGLLCFLRVSFPTEHPKPPLLEKIVEWLLDTPTPDEEDEKAYSRWVRIGTLIREHYEADEDGELELAGCLDGERKALLRYFSQEAS